MLKFFLRVGGIALAALALLDSTAGACGPVYGSSYGYGRGYYQQSYSTYAAPAPVYQQPYVANAYVYAVPVASAIVVNPYVPTVSAQVQVVPVAPVVAAPTVPQVQVPVAPAQTVQPVQPQVVTPPVQQQAPVTRPIPPPGTPVPPPAQEAAPRQQERQTSISNFTLAALKSFDSEDIGFAPNIIEEGDSKNGHTVLVADRRPIGGANVQFQQQRAFYGNSNFAAGASFQQNVFRAPIVRQQGFYAQSAFASQRAIYQQPIIRQNAFFNVGYYPAPIVRQRAFYAPQIIRQPVYYPQPVQLPAFAPGGCYNPPAQLPAPIYSPCAGAGLGGGCGLGAGAAFGASYGYGY